MIVRPAIPSDIPLVVQTFVRGGKRALWAAERRDWWKYAAEAFVADAFERDIVRVAADPDPTSDVVLGYIIAERSAGELLIHWMWVKDYYRRKGLGTRLIESQARGTSQTTVTATASKWQRDLVRKKNWRVAERLPWLRLIAAQRIINGIEEEAERDPREGAVDGADHQQSAPGGEANDGR